MQTSAVALLMIAAVLMGSAEAFSDSGVDCCLTFKDTRIPMQIVASYYHQTTESGCAIPATIFVTKKGKKLCAPPEKHPWVSKIVTHLDKKTKSPQKDTDGM